MKSLWYLAELESDVVITASSSTSGAHETLDYLPGATLLGYLASRLYSKLSSEEAFRMFHSGEVIFSDARPIGEDDAAIAIPMPLSLHTVKQPQNHTVYNFSHPEHHREEGSQYKQLRRGYLLLNRDKVFRFRAIEKSTRAKVGLSRSPISGKMREDENRLYTYNSISAGARFVIEVRAITAAAESLLDHIEGELSLRPRTRIGRSKRAEYGAVTLNPIDPPRSLALERGGHTGHHLSFVALSDCCLRDSTSGIPSLTPSARDLGLPDDVKLEWSLTHLRRRTYSPFNGKRRRVDLERQVITRGSVVTFSVTPELNIDLETLQVALARGVGEYTEAGLGQWAIMPEAIDRSALNLSQQEPSEQEAPIIEMPLMSWASAAIKERHLKVEAGELALEWEDAMSPYCRGRDGLTRSQLGNLRHAGETLNEQALYSSLFEVSGMYTVNADKGVRALKWSLPKRGVSAAATLQRLFDESRDRQHLWSLTLQATASRLVKSLNRTVAKAEYSS